MRGTWALSAGGGVVIENTGSSRSSAPTGLFRGGRVVILARPMQLGVGARRAFGGQLERQHWIDRASQ
jgi:hypothetical protein